MDIRTFVAASAGTTAIPAAVEMVRTSGYSASGDGGEAVFVYSSTTPATTARFQAADSRWFGISPNQVLRPEMFGAAGDGVTNDSPAILAALALPGGSGVQLGPKSYGIGATITVPTGRHFRGSGSALTTLVALPSMSTGNSTPPILQCANGAEGVEISGFYLNGAHVGHPVGGGLGRPQDRVHGVCPSGVGFLVKDVIVRDLWGYGFWATGAGSSGTVQRCRAANCNVLFESTGALSVLFEDCHGTTAPDTIVCEAAFHAVPDVTEMNVVSCSYEGAAPAISAVALTADQIMRFTNFRGRTTGPYVAITIGGPEKNALYFDGCDIIADGNNCLNPGASPVLIDACHSHFIGLAVAVFIPVATTAFFDGCHARTTYNGTASPPYALLAQGVVRWTGGSLDGSSSPIGLASNGGARISNSTALNPIPLGKQVRQELHGTFPLSNKIGNGPFGFHQFINVDHNIVNGAKWAMHLSRIASGGSPTPIHVVFTPKWTGGKTIKVDMASDVDLSGQIISYFFREWD